MLSALWTGNVWLSRPDGVAVGTVAWNIMLPDRYFQLNYSFIPTPKRLLNRGAEIALVEWITFTVCCSEWVVLYYDWGRRKDL